MSAALLADLGLPEANLTGIVNRCLDQLETDGLLSLSQVAGWLDTRGIKPSGSASFMHPSVPNICFWSKASVSFVKVAEAIRDHPHVLIEDALASETVRPAAMAGLPVAVELRNHGRLHWWPAVFVWRES